MKKKFFSILKVSLIIAVPLVVILTIIYLVVFNTPYFNTVTVSGNAVDNSYNNAAANQEHSMWSKLARIDDKLYYSYSPVSRIKCGAYEISNNCTKRIYAGGTFLSPEVLNLDVVGDGKILLNTKDGAVEYFDVQNGEYKPFTELKDDIANDREYKSAFYIDGNQYWYCGDDPPGIYTSYDIYACENDKLNLYFSTDKIGEDNVSAPCFDGDYIYFASYKDNGNSGEYYLYKYNAKSGAAENKISISHTGNYITASDDKAYSIVYSEDGEGKNRLTVTDINAENQKDIFNTDGSTIVNGYGGLVCVGIYSDSGGKNGLYVIDAKTDELNRIYGEEVFGVYIVDDKWIYFTDENEKLYRITPDGKTLEKVFG